jgi:hypothetical protein
MAVTHFEQQVKYGLIDTQNCESVEEGLLSLFLANDNISEAALTFAKSTGVDRDGNIMTKQATSGQVTVLRSAPVECYEAAFTSYQNGDFQGALRILGGQHSDPPSHVLAGRCREFSSNLPKDWTGVHVFKSK